MASAILDAIPGRVLLKRVREHLPPLNFITIHYLYFTVTCLITSLIFWGSSTPARSISYIDSLFLVISAMTEAGLNTVNLSQMNTFQQWLLWMHIMAGSAIFVSISVVHIRKKAFERRFGRVLKAQKELRLEKRKTMSMGRQHFPLSITTKIRTRDAEQGVISPQNHSSQGVEVRDHQPGVVSPRNHRGQVVEMRDLSGAEKAETSGDSGTSESLTESTSKPKNYADGDVPAENGHGVPLRSQRSGSDHIVFQPNTRFNEPNTIYSAPKPRLSRVFTLDGVGAAPISRSTSFRRPGADDLLARTSSRVPKKPNDPSTTLGFLENALIGRNSTFHNLTHQEREQLGGVEYRAISLLAWVVPLYFVLWQLLGSLGIGAWIAYNAASISLENGINPWWLGAFNAVSAFNNSGMSLLDANMVPFQTNYYILCTMGLLILAGNTGYPPFLRLILWTMWKVLPSNELYEDWRSTLRFALDHPRRVYTNLFPARQNWWLVFSLIALNGVDWAAFELLNIDNPPISAIPPRYRAIDGLFQALAVRSGGFYVVPITNLRIGVQVLYVVMMYISVYPVVITMRNSNVYEERSLGIYADEDESSPDTKPSPSAKSNMFGKLKRAATMRTPKGESRSYFIRQQVRGQLAHDLSWLALVIILIACIEVSNYDADPVTYSVFNIIFEVVSGYGCVGISTGVPDQAYSFSGDWHAVSKLVLCAVMLRGRHRGLPVAIDRAVLLPGEHMRMTEEEDAEVRRRGSYPVIALSPGIASSSAAA